MKFSIGYNHDLKLLNLLSLYKDNIDAFYFPIPAQYLSTSRHIAQKRSYPHQIYEIIEQCNALHIKPQLLLNATCDGASLYEKRLFVEIAEYVDKLVSKGLKSLIIANPVYIREMKRLFNRIEIESSVNSYVKTTEHALYLRDLGVDILILDNDINRDISLIKKIKDATGLKLKILLTEACLRNCPFEKIHWNYIAHKNPGASTELLPDTEKWGREFFSKNPARIFRSSFIPPEGLKYYIPLVDYFKIGSRDLSTNLIELRLKAYLNQSYNGNMVNLMDCVCMHPYFEYIDSRMLNKKGFFEKMFACNDNCGKCSYCKKLTDEAIVTNSYFLKSSDPERIKEKEKAIKIYEKILAVSPHEKEIYLKLAKSLFFLKKYKKAVKIVKTAIHLWPDASEAYILLGAFYEQTKRNVMALALYRKSSQLFSRNRDILLGLSRVYFQLKKYDEAIKNIKLVLKLGLKDMGSFFILAYCYEKIGEYKEAITLLKKIESTNPAESRINFALARCYRKLSLVEDFNKQIDRGQAKLKTLPRAGNLNTDKAKLFIRSTIIND